MKHFNLVRFDALKSLLSANDITIANEMLEPDVHLSTQEVQKTLSGIVGKVFLGFVGFAVACALLNVIFTALFGDLVGFLAAATVVFIGIVSILVHYGRKYTNKHESAYQQFIEDNAWKRVSPDDITTELQLPRQLQPNGYSRRFKEDIVQGTAGELPFWLYEYEVRRGSNMANVHPAQVLTCKIPHELPVTYMDSRLDGSGPLPELVASQNLQKIDLEGNFYKGFSLYVPQGTHIDALALYAPNVMELIQNKAGFVNIETDGQYVHFLNYAVPHLHYSYTKNLFMVADLLLQKMK